MVAVSKMSHPVVPYTGGDEPRANRVVGASRLGVARCLGVWVWTSLPYATLGFRGFCAMRESV